MATIMGFLASRPPPPETDRIPKHLRYVSDDPDD
jgi:hypothetical protein